MASLIPATKSPPTAADSSSATTSGALRRIGDASQPSRRSTSSKGAAEVAVDTAGAQRSHDARTSSRSTSGASGTEATDPPPS